jgi:transcriptional regulator with XRE-family HTH domain
VNSSKTEALAFSERLKAALKANDVKVSPTVLANYFTLQHGQGHSITPHTARNWLLGNSMPRQDHLRILANWLKVSPDQLRFGKSEANTPIFSNNGLEYEVSVQDKEFVAKYFSLTDAQKAIVRSVAYYPTET